MKNMLNIRTCRALFAGALLTGLVTGCDNADLGALDNAAYIKEAQKASSTTVKVEDDGGKTSLTVRLGGKGDTETAFRFEMNPDVLERYNALNGTSYVQLPETCFELPADPVIVPAGEVAAVPAQIDILPFTEEMDDSGSVYALPVTLRCVSGGMKMLGDASDFLIVCERKKIIPVPIFNSEYRTGGSSKLNRVMLNMKDAPITFNAYTIEFKMYKEEFTARNYMIVGFDNGEGNINNRMWVRFEASSTTSDVVNRWMQMNTMAQPGQTAVTPCEAKKWQHVAIVFDGSATSLYLDGEQVVQKSAPRNTVTFKYFALLPQPSYCNTTISFSEVRLWNVARTSTQLKNNVNNVDPKSEGLLGYWKMNEGHGYTFEDATGNGNTAECEYSRAGDLWDPQSYGPATGLEWAPDMDNM